MKKNIFEKYNKGLGFIIRNIIILLIGLLLLNYFNVLDITLLLPLRYCWVIMLYLVSFFVFSYYQGSNKKKRERVNEIVKYIFLFVLFLITLNLVNFVVQSPSRHIFPLSDMGIYLNHMLFVSGVFLLFINKDHLDQIEKEEKNEKDNEEKREKEFKYKFKRINRIPILRDIVKWMYREGWWYIVGLIAILGIFIFLRISTFNFQISDFPHYDKFRSTVPAAVTANIENDFFHNYNSFYSTVSLESPSPSSYGRFPLYQWIAYPLVLIAEYLPLGLTIRVLLLILDVLILAQIFTFFTSIFNKKIALFGLSLLSVNLFFVFSFAIPVEDKFALLFFLLGINNLLAQKHFNAYLWGGLSFLAKESFLLITVPFYVVIEFFRLKGENWAYILKEVSRNIILFSTPFLLFNLLIKDLPILPPSQRLLRISLCLLIFFGVCFCYKKSFHIDKISKKIQVLLSVSLLVAAIPFISLVLKQAQSLSDGFLADINTLFNIRMYQIIFDQIVQKFFNNYISIFILLGILILLMNPKRNKEILAIFSASATYLVLASTSIAFHEYYRHIFIILFITLMMLALHKIFNVIEIKKSLFIYICILSLSFFLGTYSITSRQLEHIASRDKTEGLDMASEFLKANTDPDEKIIYSDLDLSIDLFYLSLRNPANFNYELIRESVAKNGFTETLTDYNIRYFVSKGPSDFSYFLNMFEEIQETITPSRKEMIQHRLETHTPGSTQGFDLRPSLTEINYYINPKEALNNHNPSQYFVLEEIAGDIYIYKLEK